MRWDSDGDHDLADDERAMELCCGLLPFTPM
jgi:hypothetical protein